VLPIGATSDGSGKLVDRYGRTLTWVANNESWMSRDRQFGLVPANQPPQNSGNVPQLSTGGANLRRSQSCPVQIAGVSRSVMDTADPCAPSGSDPGGAIWSPPPSTVTNLSPNGDGS
jgi:hypothetical protein